MKQIQVPVLANCIAVYGGRDNIVTDNLLSDTIMYAAGLSTLSYPRDADLALLLHLTFQEDVRGAGDRVRLLYICRHCLVSLIFK